MRLQRQASFELPRLRFGLNVVQFLRRRHCLGRRQQALAIAAGLELELQLQGTGVA